MRFLCVLILFASTLLGQQPNSSIEAQSSGTCSPNIISNQGKVQFICDAALNKATAMKVVSLLNQIFHKEDETQDLAANSNQKLDEMLTFLKSPPPILRTDKFAVMVPYDTAPNHRPIPNDENPDDPLHKTYWNWADLASNGTVPPSVRDAPATGTITVQSQSIRMNEAPAFLGRLLQYYIFESIDNLQRNSLTVYVGYPAEAYAGIEPPDAAPYPSQELFAQLSGNKFFKPFQNRKSGDEMTWESKGIKMPRGTEIRFVEESTPTPRYIVKLERPEHFKIEYAVECLVGTGTGQVPKHFVSAQANTTMEWAFFVTMHYEIERRPEVDFRPELYVQWADALYKALQQRMDQSKQPN